MDSLTRCMKWNVAHNWPCISMYLLCGGIFGALITYLRISELWPFLLPLHFTSPPLTTLPFPPPTLPRVRWDEVQHPGCPAEQDRGWTASTGEADEWPIEGEILWNPRDREANWEQLGRGRITVFIYLPYNYNVCVSMHKRTYLHTLEEVCVMGVILHYITYV